MATNAIEDAKQINEIEFPEFTAKLVSNTFKAFLKNKHSHIFDIMSIIFLK